MTKKSRGVLGSAASIFVEFRRPRVVRGGEISFESMETRYWRSSELSTVACADCSGAGGSLGRQGRLVGKCEGVRLGDLSSPPRGAAGWSQGWLLRGPLSSLRALRGAALARPSGRDVSLARYPG